MRKENKSYNPKLYKMDLKYYPPENAKERQLQKKIIYGLFFCIVILVAIIATLTSILINNGDNFDVANKVELGKLNFNVREIEKSELSNVAAYQYKILNSDINPVTSFTSAIRGIYTFRGNEKRQTATWGNAGITTGTLEHNWKFITEKVKGEFSAGAGWTGQPLVVNWTYEQKKAQKMSSEILKNDQFTEVIAASLNGHVYFLNLHTGKQTRPSINVGNHIKGTPSLDPTGRPLLYVGEGYKKDNSLGFNIYSLITLKRIYRLSGSDSHAYRGWGAFDSSALFSIKNDSILVPGENGVLYDIKLNTTMNSKDINVKPSINKYIYSVNKKSNRHGIENSIAVNKNIAYFGDNDGIVTALDLNTLKPIWTFNGKDDIDATIVLDNNGDLYFGNEVDKRAKNSDANMYKLSGETGEIIWNVNRPVYFEPGSSGNGGTYSTPLLGKYDTANYVFFNLSKPVVEGLKKSGGLLMAIDKETGEVLWEKAKQHYSWSSPVLVTGKNKETYIIIGSTSGKLELIKAFTGEIIDSIQLSGNVESSPVVYNNLLIVGTRGGLYHAINLK